MSSKTCPRCSGEMVEGFVLDGRDHGSRAVSEWHAGPPQKSFWFGIKLSPKPLRIASFRCGRCGYLENYAPSGS